MKKLIVAAMLLLPMAALADLTTPETKEPVQVKLEDMPTVYDEYMAQQGAVVTVREYELPEFKSVTGSGMGKVTYKATAAIVSFTVGERTAYYLRISRKYYTYPEITRYISYDDLVDLRGAIDSLEGNITANPIGTAGKLTANYSIKGKFYDLGYEITTEEKKGEIKHFITWYFNIENREVNYRVCSDTPEYFKEYLGDVIAQIKKLM